MLFSMNLVSVFLWINTYAFVVASHMRMLREHHGFRRGFIMSNIIIAGAALLVVVLAYQIGMM